VDSELLLESNDVDSCPWRAIGVELDSTDVVDGRSVGEVVDGRSVGEVVDVAFLAANIIIPSNAKPPAVAINATGTDIY
jgi:hypothetical protein